MLDVLAVLVLLFWVTRIPHFRQSVLRELPVHYALPSSPKVSLVVAARDEAASIAASVRSLLSQDWPSKELIVVDDRSVDGTSEILDDLALQYPELRIIHNKELPSGWIGKCWALQRGASIASGDWLVFCDGDVMMEKHCVRSAVATAETEQFDHLCLAPRMISQHFVQDAVVFSLTFLFYIFQNPRHVFDAKRLENYIGIGAFNMIRRGLYARCGGHESLRLEIVDDVFLGMLAKRHGGKSGFFLGHKLAHIHWYEGLWAYIRGLEKNAFAGLRFSWWLLAAAVLFQSLIFLLPPLGLALAPASSGKILLASFFLSHALFMLNCQRQGGAWNRGFLLVPAILIQFITFIRSAWVMTRQRGVIWRGTFYPLAELKAAQKILRGPLFSFSLWK
jgi:glycosyltransferase involved in cell wall biosynthesis